MSNLQSVFKHLKSKAGDTETEQSLDNAALFKGHELSETHTAAQGLFPKNQTMKMRAIY